jgi:hypothetical protein
MTRSKSTSSRRSFFLRGGALLGAGAASTAGATALLSGNAPPLADQLQQLQQQLECAEERDAIRRLHLTFTGLVESQAYEAAAELFDERAHLSVSGATATGRPAILQLFADRYRHQKAAVMHSAFRQNGLQQKDSVMLSEDRLSATATFHSEVELTTPLQMDCTAAAMARLQGQVADRRWETGRFDARYVKTRGQWKMTALTYTALTDSSTV